MISGSFFSLLVYFYLLYDGMHAIVLPTDKWDTHKLRYGLLFEPTEDETRKTIFEDNMRYIERINAANLTFKLEMNHLGHMSVQELVKGINHEALKAKYPSEGDYHIDTKLKSSDPEPTEIDWRKVDAVSPVKNQGRCGSCWAFSTTGALEAQYRLKHGVMKTFSEQQLVDCDTQNIDQGCDGGLPVAAFEYLREVGLVEEKKYPYVASRNIECELNKNENSLQNTTKIRSYAVLAMDEKELTSAIYKIGPISVAIDAGSRAFQFYKSGIYQDPTCGSDVNSLNHAVLAVGYGYDKFFKRQFYIVKNSWSTQWGENGYIRMVRNTNNNCGIATFASYPVL